MDDDPKTQAEAAHWQLAHGWAQGLGLEFNGIDLADTITYSLLTVLGRIWLAEAGGTSV